MPNYTVGQKLWFVSSDNRRSEQEIIITRVGRKWLETDINCRLDVNTLVADGRGYNSPGVAYLNRADWVARCALISAWGEFRNVIDRTRRLPEGMTIERIQQAQRILFGGTGEGCDNPPETKAQAWKVYEALRAAGVEIGNASVSIIAKALESE